MLLLAATVTSVFISLDTNGCLNLCEPQTNPDRETALSKNVRSEDQLIQYVQETINSAPEQQSMNPVLNHQIL